MKYMGSKSRHAREIVNIIHPKNGELYIEPFVGGANVIDKIRGRRIGYDIDQDLICLLDAAANGWMPPDTFSEQDYKSIMYGPTTPLKGYAAFALSYGGKRFGGWCRDGKGVRNYVDEAYRNAQKQFPLLSGIDFKCSDYRDITIPDGSVVYCDPPYRGATAYKNGFDHDEFWDWVRVTSKENVVYISEYNAPDDFECIWEKAVTSSLTKDTGSKRATEKLFRIKK